MNAIEFLRRITQGEHLTATEARSLMRYLVSGKLTPAQLSAILVALRMKGETVEEMTGFAQAMYTFSMKIAPRVNGNMIDTCGTGGDAVKTFNASTVSALIAAGAGSYVAKHGNRSFSSKCGSADLLEGLGVNILAGPAKVQRCIEKTRIGFLFAPVFHPAFKEVAGVRKEIGVRTIFNSLGPLTNPAKPRYLLVGVSLPDLTETFCKVLRNLHTRRAMVVHGSIGIDEISIIGKTKITELRNGRISTKFLKPTTVGLKEARDIKQIRGGTLEENLKSAMEILRGAPGPKTDMAVLNAGVAIKLSGLADSIDHGVSLAKRAVNNDAAKNALFNLVKESGGKIEVLRQYG